MLKQTVIAVSAASLLTVALVAQDRTTPSANRPATTPQTPPVERPAAQPTPPREQPPRPAEPPGQPVNIKLEITITDQATPGDPIRKIVTMFVADRAVGSIRSNGFQNTGMGTQPVSINIDATPTILKEGGIRLQFGLEYQPRPPLEPQPQQTTVSLGRMSQINERLTVILQEGKPLLISQAADPSGDRKITVELRATIVK
jgi:hypothetical protein